MALAHEVKGEEFWDFQDSDVLDLVLLEWSAFTPKGVKELSNYPSEEDTEKTASDTSFNAKTIVEVINLVQNASEQVMNNDPIMVRSLNFRQLCDSTL